MSLINDALKRAKQAQKNNPPPASPSLPLKPAEPSPKGRGGGQSLSLPTALLVAVIVGLIVFHQFSPKEPLLVQASSPPAAAPAPAAAIPAAPPATPAVAQAEPAVPPAPAVSPAPNPVLTAAPKPAAPRLQAIFFNPRQPSAMVNGKTVRIGGRVGEFRVAAIEPASITLTSASATNVLTLEVE